MPQLNRVITYVDKDEHPWMGTFILHQEGIITLDTKSPGITKQDSDKDPRNPHQWKPIGPEELSLTDKTQRREYEKLLEFFPILRDLQQEDFKVVYGVHGRSPVDPSNPHYTQSDIMEIYKYNDLDNYLVPFGGLATSCIYDGFEVAKYVSQQFELAKYENNARLQWLIEQDLSNFLQNPQGRQGNDLARWERLIIPNL